MNILEDVIKHYGVKGMKWGVRKGYESHPKQPGYKVNDDGRIEISSGQKMQRLVTSSSRPLKGYSYMSFLPADNAQYIYKMAPNTNARGSDLKRDTILTLKTKRELKSPSLDEAQQINVELMKKHAEELKAYSHSTDKNKKFDTFVSKETSAYFDMIGKEVANGDLEYYVKNKEMVKEFEVLNKHDYASKTSELLYHPEKYPATMYAIAQRHIANDDPSVEPYKKQLLNAVESKGYNMLRDEVDVRTGLWTAPVIVLKPEENIEVVLSKRISDRTLQQSQRYVEKGKSILNAHK